MALFFILEWEDNLPKKNKKKDYTNEIKQLKKAGMKQKDIAFELGMSEAYVSKLSKKSL